MTNTLDVECHASQMGGRQIAYLELYVHMIVQDDPTCAHLYGVFAGR